MRESIQSAQSIDVPAPAGEVQVAYDERRFFESFYRTNVRGEPTDRMTIGGVSELESRFHYNATENSIIRAISRRQPPPPPAMVAACAALQKRLRALDIGSGTGHWIDFHLNVLGLGQVIGVEITEQMTDFLTRKYADRPAVSILRADAADASFTAELIGGPVDYVSAIGVMFHIVDDDRWRSAIRNLAGVLRPGGLMIVGGDFGAETRNVNFHGSDEFSTWREYATARAAAEEIRINKRVRSLAEWSMTAASCGLRVVDLVRTDRDSRLTTPENDILLLERADGA